MVSVIVLSACQFSNTSFSEIKKTPQKLEAYIDPDLTLQLINDGEKGAYIVFNSIKVVKADISKENDAVVISFDEIEPEKEDKERNLYYLKTDINHDKIQVLVNGEERPFDEISTGI